MFTLSRPSVVLSSAALSLFVSFFAGCGSSYTSNRVLESITVTPAKASAQGSSNGQVQFTATGTFSHPPSPAQVPFTAPYSGGWQTSNPDIATINAAGVAQCVASGSVTVTAMASANKGGAGAMSVGVRGTAQLTCP